MDYRPNKGICGIDKVDEYEGKLTTEMIGDRLKDILGELNWVFEDGMYPRLKGTETTSTAIVYATPIFLSANDTTNMITTDFTVSTRNGVVWTSDNSDSIRISGENATVLKNAHLYYSPTLIATLDGITKAIMVWKTEIPTPISLTNDIVTIESGKTYTISNADELKHFTSLVNDGQTCEGATIKLLNNIALGYWQDDNSNGVEDDGEIYDSEIYETAYTESNWTPIGNDDHDFTGTFDGNGHTISGIYTNATEGALFGFVSGGAIKNVSVSESYISGNYCAGIGINIVSTTIQNCTNSATVIGIGNGDRDVGAGGILVKAHNCTIQNCTNTGNISGSGTGEETFVGEGMYPRLKNMDTTDAAYVSATPIFFTDEETIDKVTKDFEVGSRYGVIWSSSDTSTIIISDGMATVKKKPSETQVTLTASKGNVKKAIKVTSANIDTKSNGGGIYIPPTDDDGADIIVNGKTESAGKATSSVVDGKKKQTVKVDNKKIEKILKNKGNGVSVIIPVTGESSNSV